VASKPQFFIDRSLGRIEVPRLLREAGLQVITLAEHYGMPRDQDVADTERIEDCSRNQWGCAYEGRSDTPSSGGEAGSDPAFSPLLLPCAC
jgi:hypothetical protein